ncbi:hypothetical protein ORI89_13535 [Sphingobacterium sp. UT-1RO-CII-1]|uniref:hypothetical protein n=1 Tax=Sphingobacterium sp. UT-1RO-CII-1 TaxID=2995225 RepID=UPI00227A9D53|nr:hypothetical protein [Sphingobacterium sp. UT-1RO-CII-1]MCY4780675.1 hypothetical protein [Sphingobacterium sp. UT-1RO-CII-1]
MNHRKLLFIIQTIILLSTGYAKAQARKDKLDSLAHQLKLLTEGIQTNSIYLRTSKDIYESMEDLWFKAYTVNVQNQLLSNIDQTLHVQLVHSATDSVVWEELYPIEQGITSGHIYLNNTFPKGTYWLCAYSAHSLKKEQDHFIDVRKIELVEDFKELTGDKSNNQKLNDSPDNRIQFNLFPEGGNLLAGVDNKVAFKAIGSDGLPRTVSGQLLEGNKTISTFKSIHDGMGYFHIRPLAGEKYTVKLNGAYTDSMYRLPPIQEQGLSLKLVENREDQIAFLVYNKTGAPHPFYLQIQTRGLPAVMAASEVKDSVLVRLPLDDVGSGIAEITLLNEQLQPLAERLIYLKPNKQITINTTLSRQNEGKKEKISLEIQATDQQNKPVIAQLGATVYDKLYHDHKDAKDIQTHYLLSKHMRGNIHNPAYYFDKKNADRTAALDLLLLTQGWRSYIWNPHDLKEKSKKDTSSILTDGITGQLIPKRKKEQQAVMLFDPEQKQSNLLTVENNTFFISPQNMLIAPSIYIKHFGKPEDFSICVEDPFSKINDIKPWTKISYPKTNLLKSQKETKSSVVNALNRTTVKIEEIVVTHKKGTAYRDKYIGQLDSIAKYVNNPDRTHGGAGGGWLNCPVGDCDEMPVEGTTYLVWIGPNPPTSHPFTFGANDVKSVVYRYPKYTEEELMKMNGVARSKGYYPKKKFYEPIYDKEKDTAPDFRNTLLWAPQIITDEHGIARLDFYTSDIESEFYGIIEGIDGEGNLGKSDFQFTVK